MPIFPHLQPSERTFAAFQKRGTDRAEVAGLSFELVETATRWDGCPNCERLRAELEAAKDEADDLREDAYSYRSQR